MLIGVYGTLKKNHYNHDLISKAEGKFIKSLKIPYYKMYSLGYYPVIIPSTDEKDKVLIEIYDVPEPAYKRMRSMELGAGYTEINQSIDNIIVKMWIYTSLKKIIKWQPELIKDGVWTLDLESNKVNNFLSKKDKIDYDKYEFQNLDDITLDYDDFIDIKDDDSWLKDAHDEYDNDDYIFLRELDNIIERDKDKDEFAMFDPTVACDCEYDGIRPTWVWDKNLEAWRCEKCNTIQV